MKQFFETPEILVERFSVTDQTMNVSWITPDNDNDETNPFGGLPSIGG